MTSKEFKQRLEDLLAEMASTGMTHADRMTVIGILEYAVFAFKLSYVHSIQAQHKEAEGGV